MERAELLSPRDASNYSFKERHVNSPDNDRYYINPADGNDAHSGLKKEQAWKTFAPVNRLALSCGDRVEILAPGAFNQTLAITGSGSGEAPIRIHFAPGRYDFFPSEALRRKYHISNTNGDPDGDKAIGILFDGAKHVEVSGAGALLVYRGKMIQVCIDGSEDIAVSDLQFDYHRPTVSEFSVTAIDNNHADINVHEDSKYEIEDGRIIWIGEGWHYDTGLAQELDLNTGEVWRREDPLKGLQLEEVKPFRLRATGRHTMTAGRVYQIRDTWRDYAAIFTRRSRDITWKNVRFLFLHGMGLVNQFSENLTFDTVAIAPDKAGGRTCAAWADGIQVSGCRGKLMVKNCTFSGAHDDAINVHGTYLRVLKRISEKQLVVRFMHRQTFGFMAFNQGDEITFVRWDSLKAYGRNTVKAAALRNPKEILLTLERPVPVNLEENDVVENITWTPEVTISGCEVRRIPTRGFLITTPRKVVVEKNRFHRTHMSAILLASDAKDWYESGSVRDMTIRNNTFLYCAEPVILINPENSVPNHSVYRRIRIDSNTFVLRHASAIRAKSTKGLIFRANNIYAGRKLDNAASMQTSDCADIQIKDNRYLPLSEWEGGRA